MNTTEATRVAEAGGDEGAAPTHAELLDQLKALRDENAALKAALDERETFYGKEASRFTALVADAERYRIVRSQDLPWAGVFKAPGLDDSGWMPICEGDLDAELDEERQRRAKAAGSTRT